jgi:hypothetical protein
MLAKVITFSCLLAVSLAAPTADAEADPQIPFFGAPGAVTYHHGLPHGVVAPAVVDGAVVAPAAVAPVVLAPAPAVVGPALLPASNCKIEQEEIETQVCTPRAVHVCETKEVVAQSVTYEKKCKEVVSRHCAAPAPAVVAGHAIFKREADAQYFGGYHGLPYAAPYHVATHEETITHPCHEVVSEHCLNSPVVVETPVPIEQCHVVNKVDCVPEVQKIAKTVCVPVVTKALRHTVNPFAYGK